MYVKYNEGLLFVFYGHTLTIMYPSYMSSEWLGFGNRALLLGASAVFYLRLI